LIQWLACSFERRLIMATYIVLGNFTDQGIRSVKETTKRAEAFREMARKAGVKVKEVYWTLGQYDLATIVEAPDEETATALGLSACSLGNIRTQTLRAFSAEEMGRIIAKMP
jgi:uncharacterized protein with GYD domain